MTPLLRNILLFLEVNIHLKHICMFFSVDSNYLILKKTDMESVFNIFQDSEENKTLVYVSISLCHHVIFTFYSIYCTNFTLIVLTSLLKQMLLSFLLREFLSNEHSLNVSAAALQKVTNSTN